jgi:structural maintenance of chromosome 3 (chondroitin sulfate proteoglycan 6)
MLQKIMELISVLDQRKDESIERTFKGVARHFREVFSELVQGGHGYLVMMKKNVSPPAFPYLLVTSPDTFYLQFYT